MTGEEQSVVGRVVCFGGAGEIRIELDIRRTAN